MTEIVGFLEGKTPDHRGRIHAILLQQTDHQAETNHDYTQWLFPLNEPSRSVNGVPVLAELEIDEIRESSLAQDNLIKSARWFLGFLERNDQWITKYNHNHLRITRVIRSHWVGSCDVTVARYTSPVGKNISRIDPKFQEQNISYTIR